MSQRDYYEVLSLSRNATEVEIKKSFRRLAMKFHPDRNPGDKTAEIKFKEVKEAYDVLSNPQKRSVYDQYGHEGISQFSNAGASHGSTRSSRGFSDFEVGGAFGDIFSSIFGDRQGGHGQARQRGADLGYELKITLEEAIHGIRKTIQIPTWVNCKACGSSGAKKGKGFVSCSRCKGSGQIHIQHGFLAIQQPCNTCHGQGKIINDPCTMCRGQGRTRHTESLSVKIPAGVDSGDRIRLSGKGEVGMFGAPAGDLYVQVAVKPHLLFKRDGNNLHTEVPIDFVMASLGGEIQVPTLSGPVKLTIAPETQNGKLFRLRGKGVKPLRGGSGRVGDLLCRIVVETPVKLNIEQKNLLKKFGELIAKDHNSPRAKSWFDSFKDFFTEKNRP